MHYVAHGVSQRGRIIAGTQAFLDSDVNVFFLIGHDGEIRQSSSAAHKLLRLATHGKFGRDEASAGSRTKQGPSLAALGGAAFPGEVDPGADCVERHTRYTQLLTTIGIELSEFGNRRDLSEQTLSVDPSPGDRFGRPR